MKSKLFMVTFLLLVFVAQAQIPQTERDALIGLYNATNGSGWTKKTNWDTNPASTSNVSTWYGITTQTIGGQEYVTEIDLHNNQLNGTLSNLTAFTKLKKLILYKNTISGTQPNMSGFANLTHLNIARNQFSGTVNATHFPTTITVIDLSKNQFSGAFPSFASLTNLVQLKLNNNQITGTADLTGYTNNLTTFYINDTQIANIILHKNYLDINIKNTPNLNCVQVKNTTNLDHYYNLPMSKFDIGVIIGTTSCSGVGNLDAAEYTALQDINTNILQANKYADTAITSTNDTKGVAYTTTAGVRKVSKLYLRSMGISGAMPTTITAFTELTDLDLSYNSINSLPNELGNLTKLTRLLLNNNSFVNLPATIGNLTALQELYLQNTPMDLLPTAIGSLTALTKLNFANTSITLIPDEIGNLVNLTELYAAPNNIASIPAQIGNLTQLRVLDFSSSQISNTPAALANLTELEYLFLNDNKLQVIAGLAGFTKLKKLRLHNNRLGRPNGTVSTQLADNVFANLTNVEELTLNDNELTTLPSSIGNVTKLKKLPLQNNKLTALPTTIGNLSALEEFNVSSNALTSLPVEIGNLGALKTLNLASNKLTALPNEIGNLSNLEGLKVNSQVSQNSTTGNYTYHLTSLPSTLNNLTKLKVLSAYNNRITGDIDVSNITTWGSVYFLGDTGHDGINLRNNRITGIKIGVAPSVFGSQSDYLRLKNNPNLTCIEVPTAHLTDWQAINLTTYTADNGVAVSNNCTGYRVPQLEREALIAFYNATGGGTKWTGTNWDTDPNGLSNVGSWEGVTTAQISGQKHVVKLDLGKSMEGIVPSQIKDLTQLKVLRLTGSSYSNRAKINSLPAEIEQLANLEEIDLDHNSLTTLPTEIGNLSSLTKLNLTRNKINTLPAGIGNFTALIELNLSSQYDSSTKTLTTLPNEIGSIATLKKLNLNQNGLTTLPTTIGSLGALKTLNLASNKLTALPNEIGNLSNLEGLKVDAQRSYNNTTGNYTYHLTSLPSTLNNLTKLKSLHASNNRIAGDIDLSNITTWSYVYFSGNTYHGIDLSDNRITGIKIGVAPSVFGSQSDYLRLKNNPNLTCIEVPTAHLTDWQAINLTTYTADNGVAVSDNCTGYRVPQLEREALIAFYNATGGGTKWTGTNWDTDPNGLSNVGSWEGVTTAQISGQKHVVKLDLGKSMEGIVPSQIKDLTQLKVLRLTGSGYSNRAKINSLPAEIGQLANLEEIDLYHNSLTTLPTEIGNLSSLTKLNLTRNKINTLPAGIGNFTALIELDLSSQYDSSTKTLTTLPNEIGSIATLKKLNLNQNGLTTLPTTIGNLSALEEFNVRQNALTSLPVEIGNLGTLKTLNLASNKLTALPNEIGNLSNLEGLKVDAQRSYNNTTGNYTYHLTSLPSTLNNLTKLKSLHASNNRIAGDIDLSNITTWSYVYFSGSGSTYHGINLGDNRITGIKIGVAPSVFGSQSVYLSLKNNPNLTCIEVPTAHLTDWQAINLTTYTADNGVAVSDNCTGYRVPQLEREALIAFYNATGGGTKWTGTNWDTDPNGLSNVGSWEGVTTAQISGQKHVVKLDLGKSMEGIVPSQIKDLTQLKVLRLTGSSYSNRAKINSLPAEIGQLANLEEIDLYHNSLTTLPTEIGNLSSLTKLNLTRNKINTLPAGIGNFTALIELDLSSQYDSSTKTLTTLPNEIGSIATLKKLDLNQNGLTTLPTTIGNLSALEELNVSSNALTNLPTTINNLTKLKILQASYNHTLQGVLDISALTVLNTLQLQYNHLDGLKLGVSPTAFHTSYSSNRFSAERNACGCIEVPTDEKVAWQLSDHNEEHHIIDNGVVYSDDCASVTNNSIPQTEREALIALYNATTGANWKNNLTNSYNGVPWVADATKTPNVGAWYGVTTKIISGQKHVTNIVLNSNKLNGNIPAKIKDLPQLKELQFNYNAISEINGNIGQLANLERLEFYRQKNNSEYVLKSIPTEINDITSLKRLEIGSNQIEGNLDFSALTNITSLDVNSNHITGLKIGVAPSVFQGGSNYFYFSSNQYLHCIGVPQSTISAWQGSSYASSNSDITWGEDCTAYNNVPQTEIQALVDMYNHLDGTNWTNKANWKDAIPTAYNVTRWHGITTKIVNGGKHITRVSLSYNKLKGALQNSIGNLSELKDLYLRDNELSGAVPTTFGNLTKLEELSLYNNQLESLPTQISAFTQLKNVNVSNNKLSGTFPNLTGATNLATLYIQNNKFQFGSFENEFTHYKTNVNSFSYGSQAKVGEAKTENIGAQGITLEAVVSGTNNTYQWYKDYSAISGATQATYTISNASSSDDGSYYCRVKNTVVTNLTIETEKVQIVCNISLGIDDQEERKKVRLYPNPAKEFINLALKEGTQLQNIKIYNALGKLIKETDKTKINISDLSVGVYWIHILFEKGRETKRFIKQ